MAKPQSQKPQSQQSTAREGVPTSDHRTTAQKVGQVVGVIALIVVLGSFAMAGTGLPGAGAANTITVIALGIALFAFIVAAVAYFTRRSS